MAPAPCWPSAESAASGSMSRPCRSCWGRWWPRSAGGHGARGHGGTPFGSLPWWRLPALLVVVGLEVVKDPPGERVINGRTGEIHINSR